MRKTKLEIEGKIADLIFLTDTNLECCKMLWEYVMEEKGGKYTKEDFRKMEETGEDIFSSPPRKEVDYLFFVQHEAHYFILLLVNHFFEAVSIVSSLLWPNNKKEISFKLWSKEFSVPSVKTTKRIKKLKGEFKEKKFLEIRHAVVAHKNFSRIRDVSELVDVISPEIDEKKIKELNEIVQDLKVETYKLFKDSYFKRRIHKPPSKSANDTRYKKAIAAHKKLVNLAKDMRKNFFSALNKSSITNIDNYYPLEYLQMQLGLKVILLLTKLHLSELKIVAGSKNG